MKRYGDGIRLPGNLVVVLGMLGLRKYSARTRRISFVVKAVRKRSS